MKKVRAPNGSGIYSSLDLSHKDESNGSCYILNELILAELLNFENFNYKI